MTPFNRWEASRITATEPKEKKNTLNVDALSFEIDFCALIVGVFV